MKTTCGILVVAVVAGMLMQPAPAKAISREGAAALGFVGGLILAGAACDSRTVVHERVVVADGPQMMEPCSPPVRMPETVGYWKSVPQQVWVPGCWVWVSGPCGYPRQVWQPGYYETTYVQVWVSGCHKPRRVCRR